MMPDALGTQSRAACPHAGQAVPHAASVFSLGTAACRVSGGREDENEGKADPA